MKKLIIESIATISAIAGIVLLTSEAESALGQVVTFIAGIAVLVASTRLLEHIGIIPKAE